MEHSLPTTSDRRLSILRVGRTVVLAVAMFVLGFGLRSLVVSSEKNIQLISPLSSLGVEEKPDNPYYAYRFDQLRALQLSPQPITIHELMGSEPSFSSYLVSWEVPDLTTGTKQKVTGQMNIPTGNGPFPVIIMLRGYVEREQYQTGVGTKNGAAMFARNGYITIAPDFLGYGGSDPEPSDMFLARFGRPVTVLQLLANINALQITLDAQGSTEAREDLTLSSEEVSRTLFQTDRVGMWAHSNGGQIGLSVLQITSRTLPTTLWAPVSESFPYNMLYYSNDLSDKGKYQRAQLSHFEFELGNDVQQFSVLSEPQKILAPIQVHQGAKDDAVPLSWSQKLVDTLKDATVSAELFTYPAADHNLQPDWNLVIQRDLQFFARHLKN